ncbi:MAG: hypothetical protein U5J64_06810 [Halobacteriales archaeon]|nr:hypothetical protein [Halobacteriales archaeon]
MAESESDQDTEIVWKTGLEIYEERMENGELEKFEKTWMNKENTGDGGGE